MSGEFCDSSVRMHVPPWTIAGEGNAGFLMHFIRSSLTIFMGKPGEEWALVISLGRRIRGGLSGFERRTRGDAMSQTAF